jgi:hypothetical protein
VPLISLMHKKNLILTGLALALAAVYVIWFTDWFRPAMIQIAYSTRTSRYHTRHGQPIQEVLFALNQSCELTEIKVVPLPALQTNELAQPVWHLVGDPSSDALSRFIYGQRIAGMNPAIKGTRPAPLQPGITYRIFIKAGSAKGWRDFQSGGGPQNTASPQ